MRKYGLVAKVRKRNPYKQIMKKRLEHRIFPNTLQREFHQTIPYQVFCTDITYLPFQDQFAYLSVVKDIASGEAVAWNISKKLDMELVIATMKKIKSSLINNTLIHSDQGFHYTNPNYIKIVKELNMNQSMSGKGNCIDNAPIESFFGHLKDELDCKLCKTFEELYSKINNYMVYYNQHRKQWSKNTAFGRRSFSEGDLVKLEYTSLLILLKNRGRPTADKVRSSRPKLFLPP